MAIRAEFRGVLIALGIVGVTAGLSLVILATQIDPGQKPWHRNESLYWSGCGLAAFGILLLIGAMIWTVYLLFKKPTFAIEYENDNLYFWQQRPPDARHVDTPKNSPIKSVYVTRLGISETRGVRAPGVQVRVTVTHPRPDPLGEERLPAKLQWAAGGQLWDMPPKDRENVELCSFVEHEDPSESWVYSYVPHVKRGEQVTITVEVSTEGHVRKTQQFLVDWTRLAFHPQVRPLP